MRFLLLGDILLIQKENSFQHHSHVSEKNSQGHRKIYAKCKRPLERRHYHDADFPCVSACLRSSWPAGSQASCGCTWEGNRWFLKYVGAYYPGGDWHLSYWSWFQLASALAVAHIWKVRQPAMLVVNLWEQMQRTGCSCQSLLLRSWAVQDCVLVTNGPGWTATGCQWHLTVMVLGLERFRMRIPLRKMTWPMGNAAFELNGEQWLGVVPTRV